MTQDSGFHNPHPPLAKVDEGLYEDMMALITRLSESFIVSVQPLLTHEEVDEIQALAARIEEAGK